MERISDNLDAATVRDFGREWQRFDQSGISQDELARSFAEYFAIFPWASLPPNANGIDFGCGSGRWATLVAPRVGHLHCVDASAEALAVAQINLSGRSNVTCHQSALDHVSLPNDSMDFAYSLGVLHHLPNPQAGLTACVKKLKAGAPMLVYIYYAFDNRPAWFHLAWQASDYLRSALSQAPYRFKLVASELLATFVYWPLGRTALLFERLGGNVANWPLSAYRWRSFYSMRNDALDRFGTRLEHRMTKLQIADLMQKAGLRDIRFSDSAPYWCAIGRKI